MAKRLTEDTSNKLKRFKKIPVYIVEEHNDALNFIYSAIGGKKLPVDDNTILHLDAHPDLLVSRKLTGCEARSGRALLPLLEIENWIVPACAAGHISNVIWLRPPWAYQIKDGNHAIRVGDHSDSGFLRLDCPEPYFLSDALYSRNLVNDRTFSLTVAELGDPNNVRSNEEKHVKELVEYLHIPNTYILDIDLDFFSTDNPFLSLYENVGLYDKLKELYEFELPSCSTSLSDLDNIAMKRERQLGELEELFNFLEEKNTLDGWSGEKTELYYKVVEVMHLVQEDAASSNDKPDWWAIHAAGCTCDQGGLPVHRSDAKQLHNLVTRSLRSLLGALPSPTIITVARSTDDGYCPQDQVDEIQSIVLQEIQNAFETDEPVMHYKIETN